MSEPTAIRILRAADVGDAPVAGRVTLDYDARFLRRTRLTTDDGGAVRVDLADTVSLDEGDALGLEEGGVVIVGAAAERLLAVTGDLPRLAWHIGNRHTPCQIDTGRLLIREDPVLARMLQGLGAGLQPVIAPFTPEGGAYGHGRTHGHSHD